MWTKLTKDILFYMMIIKMLSWFAIEKGEINCEPARKTISHSLCVCEKVFAWVCLRLKITCTHLKCDQNRCIRNQWPGHWNTTVFIIIFSFLLLILVLFVKMSHKFKSHDAFEKSSISLISFSDVIKPVKRSFRCIQLRYPAW